MLSLFGPLLLFPFVFLGIVVAMLVKRRYMVAAYGVAFALIGFVAMVWSINQSRSSTAAIGYLGVPFGASLMGFLGVAFGLTFSSAETARKLVAGGACVLAFVFLGFTVGEGFASRRKNSVRDEVQAAFSAEVARDRDVIDSALRNQPGHERVYLD